MKQTFENRRIEVSGARESRGLFGSVFGSTSGLDRESSDFGAKFFGGVLLGAALGALFTHFSDPILGRSRRAKLQDKGRHYLKVAQWQGMRRARNFRNRAKGFAYETSHRFQQGSANSVVDDETLLSRVRSSIGHKVSHPRSIHVDVKDGCVTLSGVVLNQEVQGLIQKTRSVPGVRSVVSRMDMHSNGEHIPGLQ